MTSFSFIHEIQDGTRTQQESMDYPGCGWVMTDVALIFNTWNPVESRKNSNPRKWKLSHAMTANPGQNTPYMIQKWCYRSIDVLREVFANKFHFAISFFIAIDSCSSSCYNTVETSSHSACFLNIHSSFQHQTTKGGSRILKEMRIDLFHLDY